MGGGIENSQNVTEIGKYALDAVQNNPSIEGSLRQKLNSVLEKAEANKISWDRKYLSEATNANLYRDNGIYRVSGDPNHKNFADTNGFFIVFAPEPNTVLQINTNHSGIALYFRTYWYGTWCEWKRIAYVS